MNKIIDISQVKDLIKDNDRILVGGFGATGSPLTILDEVAKLNVKDLEIVSNNLGENGQGLHKVFVANKIKKAIGSFFTINKEAVMAWTKGQLEIELLPQGTLAEAIRAGGAGIGGFYTRTAVGTELAEGKETKVIDGQTYIFEKGISGNVALIKAEKADRLGNLTYCKTARNFNPMMATAADIVIVEVDELVDELDPEIIVTPHIYVDYVVKTSYKKEGGKYVEFK